MQSYNAAFFGLFENVFKILKQEYGEEKALSLFSALMEAGLSKAYGSVFKKGEINEFAKLVGDRDKAVGLHVELQRKSDNQLIYQFYDDPFPNLKGQVDPYKLDSCYMSFKINYLLGDNWNYKTTKHLWHGDYCTEHLIFKSPAN